MKKLTTLFIILILTGGIAYAQGNQSAGASQSAALGLSDAIDISFMNAGASISMQFNNVNDYANGIESDEQTLLVRSNKKFNVRVKASASKFTYSGPSADPKMKVSDVLKVKITANNTGGTISSGFANYKSPSTGGTKIINNATPGGNNTFSVKYLADPGFEYPAGTYTVDIVYTATQA